MESTRHPRSALHWLTEAAADPDTCREAWERTGCGLALLPAGSRWDVLLAPGPLGRLAVPVLDRLGSAGPVYTDACESSTGFLVPVGTAARWIGTGVRGIGADTWIALPHPARRRRGLHWLSPPDGSGRLVDPALLELALHDAATRLPR